MGGGEEEEQPVSSTANAAPPGLLLEPTGDAVPPAQRPLLVGEEEEETGAKEEGQQRQRTSPPPPASIMIQLQPPEREQGEAWFESVTDAALWENTHGERAKAVLIDRGVKVFHNRRAHYPASIRDSGIGSKARVLTNEQLTCRLPNGQVVDRVDYVFPIHRKYLLFCMQAVFDQIASIRYWLL